MRIGTCSEYVAIFSPMTILMVTAHDTLIKNNNTPSNVNKKRKGKAKTREHEDWLRGNREQNCPARPARLEINPGLLA